MKNQVIEECYIYTLNKIVVYPTMSNYRLLQEYCEIYKLYLSCFVAGVYSFYTHFIYI